MSNLLSPNTNLIDQEILRPKKRKKAGKNPQIKTKIGQVLNDAIVLQEKGKVKTLRVKMKSLLTLLFRFWTKIFWISKASKSFLIKFKDQTLRT